jgi:hypothetical protein
MTFAKYILDNLGIGVDQARVAVEDVFRDHDSESPPPDTMSAIVERACAEAQDWHFVGSEHILLSALQLAGPGMQLTFHRLGLSLSSATARAKELVRKAKSGF